MRRGANGGDRSEEGSAGRGEELRRRVREERAGRRRGEARRGDVAGAKGAEEGKV